MSEYFAYFNANTFQDMALRLWDIETYELVHSFVRDEENQCYGHMRPILDCDVRIAPGIGREPAPDIQVLSCSQDMSMKAWIVRR